MVNETQRIEWLGAPWDSVVEGRIGIDDLDLKALAQFCDEAIRKGRLDVQARDNNEVELINALHLSVKGQLKKAAILLFHPEPETFVTGTCVKIGYFGQGGEVLYQDVVRGPLFQQEGMWIEFKYDQKITTALSPSDPENDLESDLEAAVDPENDLESDLETAVDPENDLESDLETAADPENDPRKNLERGVEHQIIEYLRQHPKLTIAQLSLRTRKSESTLKRVLKRLQKSRRLKRVGPDRGGHWQVLD